MSAFMIEITQGCVKTWKKSTKSITIEELRSLVQEAPQSFKGDVANVDFRLEVGGDVLSEDYQVVKATKLFSKKRDGKKSAVSSSSTPSSKKATSSKKEKEGYEVQVDLPVTVSGPSSWALSGRAVCFLYPTAEAATEFAVQTCSEYDIDLKKNIGEQEKQKKKLEADKLRKRLAELEADEQGDEQGSSSSSSEGEEIDIEDIDVDSADKQKEEPVADEPVVAVAKSKSSKKGSK